MTSILPFCYKKLYVLCRTLFFITKLSFRRIWTVFFPFSKTSSDVYLHTITSTECFRGSTASLFQSEAVHGRWSGCVSTPGAGDVRYTDLPSSESKLCLNWWKINWEKLSSNISCNTTWLPLTPVYIEVPACLEQQHSEALRLHWGHNGLLSASIPIRLSHCHIGLLKGVSRSYWSHFGFPVN